MVRAPVNRLGHLVVLGCAVAYFIWRGPVWAVRHTDFYDLRVNYAAARAFWHGDNPYSQDVISRTWLAAGNPAAETPSSEGTPSLYPPTSFIFFAPAALLPWRVATVTWLGVHLLALCILLWLLDRHLVDEIGNGRRLALLSFVLAFTPLQISFANGQPTASVFILLGFAILAAHARKQVLAAVLLTIALSLKPHVAAGLLLYHFAAGRRRIFWLSATFTALIAAVAAGWLNLHQIPWLHDWRVNLHAATLPGAISDSSPSNPLSVQIISLDVILYRLISNGAAVHVIVWMTAALLLLATLLKLRRQSESLARELLSCGAVIAVSMLPVYHRYYDAVFFLFAVYWIFCPTLGGNTLLPRLSILACALFYLIPPGSVAYIGRRLHLDAAGSNAWWWRMVQLYPAWAALGIAVAMTVAVAMAPRAARKPGVA